MKTFMTHLREQQFHEKVSPFLDFCADYLELNELPQIHFINEKSVAIQNRSFGGYSPGEQCIRVNIAERHAADIFRTLAHELVHYKQDCDGRLDSDSGRTGSLIENEANAVAGIILRNYAQQESSLFEEKDACYTKVKRRYRIWPSAYASGALAKCRKVGADNWGNKSENIQEIRDWFAQDWVRVSSSGKILGPCGDRKPHEGKPKCFPRARAHTLGRNQRAAALKRKRKNDPNANRRGRAINVSE